MKPDTKKPIPKKLRGELAVCSQNPEKILFLDIETTGLSIYYDDITIVGWSFGGSAKTLISGEKSDNLFKDAREAHALVTFNGIRFDKKFLEKEFPAIVLPSIHIDLMYLCRRVGLTGGQKKIENLLGLDFRGHIPEVDGFAAVLLWHSYLRGESDALKRLIQYNRADIAAMGAIFDEALARLEYEPDLLGEEVSFKRWAAVPDREKLPKIPPYAPAHLKRAPTFRELFHGLLAASSKVVGIDLTGSEARASGWSLLDGKHATTALLKTDEEIVKETKAAKPDLISIDSPLCLPFGRNSVFDDDPTRDEFGIMRQSERELKRRGINVYPSLLPSMQKLTARGISLAEEFRKSGIPVIESYPGAAQDIMRIPRKGAGVEWLKMGLLEFGVEGAFATDDVSHDELDAITSALVGTFHLAELSEELAGPLEAPMVIPRLKKVSKPLVVGVSGRIATGKTTIANALHEKGFSYTRFSLVIDQIAEERGLSLNRENRQAIGLEINETGRQRELAERTIGLVGSADRIVVDGLRFPDDHAFLFETFAYRFHHLFVETDEIERFQRFMIREELSNKDAKVQFDLAGRSLVKRGVPAMKPLADSVYINDLPIYDIGQDLETRFDWLRGESKCL